MKTKISLILTTILACNSFAIASDSQVEGLKDGSPKKSSSWLWWGSSNDSKNTTQTGPISSKPLEQPEVKVNTGWFSSWSIWPFGRSANPTTPNLSEVVSAESKGEVENPLLRSCLHLSTMGEIPVDTSLTESTHTHKLHVEEEYPFVIDGLAMAEGTHRWTASTLVTFELPLDGHPGGRPTQIKFSNVGAFLHGDLKTQPVKIKLNGSEIVNYHYNSEMPNHDIAIDLPPTLSGVAKIEFELPNATSPKSVGVNSDERTLALQFSDVSITRKK